MAALRRAQIYAKSNSNEVIKSLFKKLSFSVKLILLSRLILCRLWRDYEEISTIVSGNVQLFISFA